jgi:CheY-like chemotaxis protein
MSNLEAQPTVLLVDDDDNTRISLQSDLQRESYQVITASNGSEAISMTRHRCPDLVITDIFLPQTDGLELIQYFRRTCPVTKIIVLSKTSGSHYLEMAQLYLKMARLLGAAVALPKPLSSPTLLEIVKQQIRKE